MISIQKKRFLRKPSIIEHDNWTQCNQHELILLFKILNSSWYSNEGRSLIREFLSEPTSAEIFLVQNVLKYVGPDKELRSMTIGQWAYIERMMFNLSQDYNKENVGKLMASIYTDGKQFTPESITRRAAELQNLPKAVIDATIFCWYAVRNWVYSIYPYVFPKQNNVADNLENQKAPDYLKIIRGLSAGNADSDIEKIFNSRMHNILGAINEDLKNKKY